MPGPVQTTFPMAPCPADEALPPEELPMMVWINPHPLKQAADYGR